MTDFDFINDSLPYVVGVAGGGGYVIGRFATHDLASEFIGTMLPPAKVEAGVYYIDGPEVNDNE